MPIFTSDSGIKIYYEYIGETKGKNELCVLLGGLTRDHTIWRKLTPLLEKHYDILLIDNRDSGQSISNYQPYEIADMAHDIAELMKINDFSSAHIIGHSMGGFMAIHLAAKYPELVKTLALCSTAEKQVPAAKAYLTTRVDLIDKLESPDATTASKEDILAVMDKIYAPESLKSTTFVDEIVSHETSNPHPQPAISFKRQAQACMTHDASHLVKDITCPTVIITGEKDMYYTPQLAAELASKIKGASINIISHAAHIIQLEQPKLFSEMLITFINAHKNRTILGCKL